MYMYMYKPGGHQRTAHGEGALQPQLPCITYSIYNVFHGDMPKSASLWRQEFNCFTCMTMALAGLRPTLSSQDMDDRDSCVKCALTIGTLLPLVNIIPYQFPSTCTTTMYGVVVG